MRFMFGRYSALVLAAGLAVEAMGNNLQVTNTTVRGYQRGTCLASIHFDISWENSWRYTNINHDAAWVFFKFRRESGDTNWTHVKLAGSGTNPAGYSTGTGTGIEIIVPDDGMGMFIRRALEGSGAVTVQNVRAVWNFVTNGLTSTNKVLVQTLAIEMVYVAEGPFYVGSGGTESGHFISGYGGGASNNDPFLVQTEAQISVSNQPDCLWGTSEGGYNTIGPAGVLSNAYPKGYNAFYCMKYEITQGQYTDFLNLLTATQAGNRFPGSTGVNRQTIGINVLGVYTNGAPDRVCNYLSWVDGAAYADWSGLRPMTELEFEKACRGTNTPVANEYAWGIDAAVTLAAVTGGGGDGSGTETSGTANANCLITGGLSGPTRAGIFATATSTRAQAGASYWGIMELSGSQWERVVTVGKAAGRLFTGTLGDGVLAANGDATNNVDWPGTSNVGAGYRGGGWADSSAVIRVSDRTYVAYEDKSRYISFGWRAVRPAPSGVGP